MKKDKIKSHFVFVFTEMVGETIKERKLKKTVSFDNLEMPSEDNYLKNN